MGLVSRHVTLTQFGKLLDVQTPEKKQLTGFFIYQIYNKAKNNLPFTEPVKDA
jgi:hypothetical protein